MSWQEPGEPGDKSLARVWYFQMVVIWIPIEVEMEVSLEIIAGGVVWAQRTSFT